MDACCGAKEAGPLTIRSGEPPARKRVEVRTTNTAVRNLDVDIVLGPLLGLVGTPLHLALHGLGALAQPAFELGGSCHGV